MRKLNASARALRGHELWGREQDRHHKQECLANDEGALHTLAMARRTTDDTCGLAVGVSRVTRAGPARRRGGGGCF
eukprot:COSAG01_NODE_30792_length_609_cov_1.580392_1_plen_76_part_00